PGRGGIGRWSGWLGAGPSPSGGCGTAPARPPDAHRVGSGRGAGGRAPGPQVVREPGPLAPAARSTRSLNPPLSPQKPLSSRTCWQVGGHFLRTKHLRPGVYFADRCPDRKVTDEGGGATRARAAVSFSPGPPVAGDKVGN